jgi:heme exporter protein C
MRKVLGVGLPVVGVLMLAVGAWLGLKWAQPEQYMGDVQRIMYVHVPAVWMALLAMVLNFVASVRRLMDRRPMLFVGGALGLLAVVGGLGYQLAVVSPAAGKVERREIASRDGAPALGTLNPKLTLVAWTGLPCSGCAGLTGTLQHLEEIYRGKLRVEYRVLPGAQPAAADALLAAHAQGKFTAFHEALASEQIPVDAAALERIATAAGLNVPAFQAALAQRPFARAVEADKAQAAAAGINAAPALFLNGRPLSVPAQIATLRAVADDELALQDRGAVVKYLVGLGLVAALLSALGAWIRTDAQADALAEASAEVGVLFGAVGVLLGAIWAKPTWGVWWDWDPRLTSAAILLVAYSGYLALRKFVDDTERRAVWSAVVAIISFVDVPIIYYSVRWWRSLHQVQSTPKDVAPDMVVALRWNSFAFLVFLALFIWRRYELSRAQLEAEQLAPPEAPAAAEVKA